jgi:ribosomal protein S18 acetylase RimI-like enzyme
MSPIVSGLIHRRPFHAAGLPGLLAFAAKHPVSYVDAETFERGLYQVVSEPASVIDLFAGDERVALAMVYDRLNEPPDTVLAMLLAAGEVPDWAPISEIVLTVAEDLARAAGKRTLTVSWLEPLPLAVSAAFAGRGQRPMIQEYRMDRAGTPASATPPLPPGWRWEDVDAARMPQALALVRLAFAGQPSFLPDEDDLVRFLLSGRQRSRVLCDASGPAAFVHVSCNPAQRLGYVGPIARHPSYRGRGLGDLLVAESLSLLAGMQPTRICLDVTATNTRALDLYRRHGFEIVRQVGFYRREGPV